MSRAGVALALSLVAAACAGPAKRVAGPGADDADYARRAEQLIAKSRWSLTARLGVDNGHEGGSGRLEWVVNGDASTLYFRGTLGRGSWRLVLDDAGATLSRADGTVIHDPSAAELISREAGLDVPVDALHWWVRGMASPDAEFQVELDAGGLPLSLDQDGWLIRYGGYQLQDSLWLPRKVQATRGAYRVRLAISRWAFPAEQAEA